MHIVLLGIKPELSDPRFRFHECGTCEEAQEVSSIIKPKIILVVEDLAQEFLPFALSLAVKMVVISEAYPLSLTAVRSWTALGAADVWANREWPARLRNSLDEQKISAAGTTSHEHHERNRAGERTVIAVGSVFEGAGSTHTALLIAEYLARVAKTKVAVWEGGSHPCFSFLEYIRQGEFSSSPRYEVNSLSLFKGELSEHWVHSLMNEYRFTVLDLGSLHTSSQAELFVQSRLPVLVGSGSEWRTKELISFCREHQRVPQDYWRIALPLASEENQEIIAGCLSGRPVFAIPYHPDPFKSDPNTDELLEGLLSPILDKPKKRGLARFF
ncbi:hypothetical protein [Paenibacillus sp. FSL L8-0463]|uniref:hypothetical protein n=1 Tax=Paenibacillus sp. FSL L8-0463 TaxID=2954687 RepID=UPI00311935DF